MVPQAGTQQGCWEKATRADLASLYGYGHTDHQGTCELGPCAYDGVGDDEAHKGADIPKAVR